MNAFVLNQCCHVRWSAGKLPSCPAIWSGREMMPVPVVSSVEVIGVGNPVWAVMIVETCQPSNAYLPTPCSP